MATKRNYKEGDCFYVSLRDGGYARGVIARIGKGGELLGYFFGPKFKTKNEVTIDETLYPGNEIMLSIFGDLGLLEGHWKVIGSLSNWNREKWILPKFLRINEIDKTVIICEYSEKNLSIISEQEISMDSLKNIKYPEDGLMGYGYVEIELGKKLNNKNLVPHKKEKETL